MSAVSLQTGSVGIVETQYATVAHPPAELVLESGRRLGPITIAYETYGTLSESRDNVVLILHALSGDAHAAGKHSPDDRKPGWWDPMIGPAKAFDTNKYFMICANVIGGCSGTTGPCSIDPDTARPYGLSFPLITIGDMVNAQKLLLDHLGIERLLCVAGGSMGGMQALQFAVSYPEMVDSAIPIATTVRHSAQNIAFNEVGRQAITADPNWNNGDYYGGEPPSRGLSLARMIGHITYLSDQSMHQKFGRKLQDRLQKGFEFEIDFQVESYLQYKGSAFTERFDANSYLYISKALDYFDLTEGGGDLAERFRGVKTRFLVISFSSDWLYPTYQAKEIVRALKANGIYAVFCEVQSDYGHDAFLLESEQQTRLIRDFLSHTYSASHG